MRETCCCCISLRTGGLIIVYLGIFASVGYVISGIQEMASGKTADAYTLNSLQLDEKTVRSHGVELFIAGLVGIAVNGLCAYGIHNNRHSFMLLHLVLSWIAVGFGILVWVAALFLAIFFTAFIQEIIENEQSKHNDLNRMNNKEAAMAFGVVIAICLTAGAIGLAFMTYFTVVIHRLYKYIKETAHELLPTSDKYVHRTR